jgi:hypothetical protein
MKQAPRSFATAVLFPVLTLAFACAATISVVPGCSSTGASPTADAGHDLGTTQDTAGGGCPARPDLVAAAPTCTSVVNSATAIPFTPATGTAPTPAGGTIADGLYESTRTEAYGTTTGNGRRITFVISGGATRMLWNGEVLDATGTTVVASFRADTAISVSGTRINFTANCVSTTPSPIPAALDFSVSGANLVLSLATGNTVAATTYTRRGCAP